MLRALKRAAEETIDAWSMFVIAMLLLTFPMFLVHSCTSASVIEACLEHHNPKECEDLR